MSVIHNDLLLAGDDAYNLTKSLRFRASASAYLSRTFGTATNSTVFTFSTWIKKSKISAWQGLFTRTGAGDGLWIDDSTGAIRLILSASASSTAVFRDPSSYYHLVWSKNGTSNTVYINNTSVLTLTGNSSINSANAHAIGGYVSSGEYFDGYLAETHFIDGQALTPSSFGANNAQTGVWQPKRYAGTYGTNGFYLPFTDNSALTTSSNVGLGKDFSGNGNYWTTNNISITAGTTYDSMTDVPTLTSATQANYCTLNPLDTGVTTTNGNLTMPASSFVSNRATMQMPTSGKWYFEATVETVSSGSNSACIGLCTSATSLSTYPQNTTGGYCVYWTTAGVIVTASVAGNAISGNVGAGQVIQCAYDADTGKLYIGKANTFYDSSGGTTGNPSAGTGQTLTVASSLGLFPYIHAYSNRMDANYGQRPFAYTPPTGFVALNTFNLPTPTIGATASTQANKYFDVQTYTGNAASPRDVGSFNFSPDFVWTKSRSTPATGSSSNWVYDTVRGVGTNSIKTLVTDSTGAEFDGLGSQGNATAFTSSGITLTSGSGGNANRNENNVTYVMWGWKANGSGSTNTAGSITSTVSANTSAGFSVVTWTGAGSTGTIGHGLGVAPNFIILKRRNAAVNWYVGGSNIASVGNGTWSSVIEGLNTTGAVNTGATAVFNSTAPTSTVFTGGSELTVNGGTYVAYCFAEVAGYSKFGSYTGNGSADGVFLYTGFKPKYVMIKSSSNTRNWIVQDGARNPYNAVILNLYPNLSDAEGDTTAGAGIDFVSNGIKLRNQYGNQNASGESYIYMAFAENPFKYSLAR